MKLSLKRMKVAPRLLIMAFDYLTRIWAWSLRLTVVDPHGFTHPETAGPKIFITWHNRLFLITQLLPRHARRRLYFLASRSRDGGYISDFMIRREMHPVRGSSSRGGAQALAELRDALHAGAFVAVTPDGPRGPRYEVHDGVVWLGSKAQAPIIPVAINYRHYWEVRSWDRTQIPWPFTKTEMVFGDPLQIAADLDDAAFDAARQAVREALMTVIRDRDQAPGAALSSSATGTDEDASQPH